MRTRMQRAQPDQVEREPVMPREPDSTTTVPCRHCDNGFVGEQVDGIDRVVVCRECSGTRWKPVTAKECDG